MKKILILSLIYLLIVTLNSCIKRKIERNGCESPAFSEIIGDSCGIYVPNIFTPNGDGINDILNIMCFCNISDFKFEVKKNRKIIFNSSYSSAGWDGTFKGELQTGVFDYSVSGKIDGLNFSNNGEITCLPNLYDVDYIIKNCENCNTGSQFTNGIFDPQIPLIDLFCN